MQENNVLFPEVIYLEHLAIINGVNFTRREIDVIACLLSMRGTSKIALLLSIAPRTVVTHIRNIMLKLECNSREGIIDFIEKSHKLHILRDYYAKLIIELAFEKALKEISKLKCKESAHQLIVYCKNQKLMNDLLHRLSCHLSQVGIKAEAREHDHEQKIETTETLDYVLILLLKKNNNLNISQHFADLGSINLSEHKNYYFLVFTLLENFFPHAQLSGIFTRFQEQYEGLQSPTKEKLYKEYLQEKPGKNKTKITNKIGEILNQRNGHFILTFLIMSLVSIGLFAFKLRDILTPHPFHLPINQTKKKELSIRSDLILPIKSALLERPELIAQIDKNLKGQGNIKTVALVGAGGAGKTTLARQYAHQQKNNLIWEINAETPETLKSSFETLAQALVKTEEDKKLLRDIQDVKTPRIREEKIIQFIKEHLRQYSSWFLIYDNVEKFTDIQRQFPQDAATWGTGKIILTTRDTNIQNNKLVTSIVFIGELNRDQKFDLFKKVLDHEKVHSLTSSQLKEMKAFLENIPPFPLDVSVAAYYLKTTNVPYTAYLESLKKHNKDFEKVQENLLKEAGDYIKTRYGIITVSLQHIISTHKDFGDLLLFISLLDSQNIPRDLLDRFKTSTVVDKFIYNLKKYSLITNEGPVFDSVPSFSIHRSTQTISLAYLNRTLNLEKNHYDLKLICQSLEAYMADLVDKEDCSRMKLLLSHCERFLSYPDLLTADMRYPIESELGAIYFYQNYFTKAKSLLEQNLSIYKKYPDSIWVARALGSLGTIYRYLGNYNEAKAVLEQSLIIYKKLSESNVGFAKSLSWLGDVYRILGNYEKAKQVVEQSILAFKKYSENHPGIAWSVGRLGFVYRDLGNHSKSKQFLEQSLVLFERHSETHVVGGVTQAWGNIGAIYRYLGQYEKAKQVLEQSLVIYKRDPENSLWAARAMGDLGSVYRELGNYEKAQQLFEQSLAIYKKDFPENHIWIAHTLARLGIVHEYLGNYEKARLFLEESLAIYKNHLSENHIWIARASGWLGTVYRELGSYEKAKDFLEQDLIICKKYYGTNHIGVAWSLGHLGRVYTDLGNYEKALEFLKQSFEIYETIFGRAHVEAAQVLRNLGRNYFLEGHIETAEDCLHKALEIFQKSNHPDIYLVFEDLAELHFKKASLLKKKRVTKQPEYSKTQVITYLNQAFNSVKTNFPKDSPHAARIEMKLQKFEKENL